MAKLILFLALSAVLVPAFAQKKCKSISDCDYQGGQAYLYCNVRVGLCSFKTPYLDGGCTYDEDCDATVGTKGPPPDYKGPMICTKAHCAKKVAASAAPCAPAKAGYTLRAGTNWGKLAGAIEAQAIPAEAEKICNSDPKCLAWNSFGYYIIASSGSLSFSPYTGLCVYVKNPTKAAAGPTTASTGLYGCPKDCDEKCAAFNTNVIKNPMDCSGERGWATCNKTYGPGATCESVGKAQVCWISTTVVCKGVKKATAGRHRLLLQA